jgi:hypothetical protein
MSAPADIDPRSWRGKVSAPDDTFLPRPSGCFGQCKRTDLAADDFTAGDVKLSQQQQSELRCASAVLSINVRTREH